MCSEPGHPQIHQAAWNIHAMSPYAVTNYFKYSTWCGTCPDDTTCSKSIIIINHVFILSQNDESMYRIIRVVVIIKCNFLTRFMEWYRAYSFMVIITEPYFNQEYDVCLLFVSTCFLNINHSWWRHPMETFPRYWPFVRGIHRSPMNSPQKGQWRGALMFSLICAWANGRAHSRDAGDLRRHRAHY